MDQAAQLEQIRKERAELDRLYQAWGEGAVGINRLTNEMLDQRDLVGGVHELIRHMESLCSTVGEPNENHAKLIAIVGDLRHVIRRASSTQQIGRNWTTKRAVLRDIHREFVQRRSDAKAALMEARGHATDRQVAEESVWCEAVFTLEQIAERV